MAARPGERRRIELSPRGRLIAGWIAALLLIGAIALTVRLLGGNADGAAILPAPSASVGGPIEIAFGTQLGPDGSVVEASRTKRFVRDDTFAYSVPDASAPPVVHVSVERIDGGVVETVQALADGAQRVPEDRSVIGFTVGASVLLDAFGPGRYRMRIHLDPAEAPIAEGTFELIEPPGVSPGS